MYRQGGKQVGQDLRGNYNQALWLWYAVVKRFMWARNEEVCPIRSLVVMNLLDVGLRRKLQLFL